MYAFFFCRGNNSALNNQTATDLSEKERGHLPW